MTVQTQVTKVTASGNDSTTVFSGSPLVIFASTDIEVTKTDSLGAETLLSEGSSSTTYSVSPTGSYDDGTTFSITYPAVGGTPLATGETITIKRVLTLEQQTDLENQGGYFPEVLEVALDKLVMQNLQQQEELDRAIKVPVSYTGAADFTLPTPSALTFFRWDATGLALETVNAAALGAVVASSDTPENVSLSAGASGSSADYSRKDHVHLLPTVTVAKGGTGQVTETAARVQFEIDRPVQSKSTTYTQVSTDRNNMIRFSATATYDLLAAATAGNDFQVDIMADGGAVTIDPNDAELVNGASTYTVPDGTSGTLFCDGTGWYFLAGGAGGGSFKGENGTVAATNVGDIFRVHEQTLNTDVTIAAAENALCAGPLTVANTITLTVANGGTLVVA